MTVQDNARRARGTKQHHRDRLSIAQARVLRALSYGGMLTKHQIERAAGLTRWSTRQCIGELGRRYLIFTSPRTGRFEITELGRTALAAQHPDFGRWES